MPSGIDEQTQLVVIFGSINDGGSGAGAAANSAAQALRRLITPSTARAVESIRSRS